MLRYDVQHVTGVREGEVFAGKYRVEHVLGAGGMGVVVAAHHLQLDEKIAIKFLRPDLVTNTDSVSRFVREARAAVKIKSEHVARVFDVGTLESGLPYMVMERLEGGDLAGWLREHGPLPMELAVEFVLQACVAVAEAHQLGIVHRDLKPANLFWVQRPDGQLAIKVLDFGISKMSTFETSVSVGTDPAALMGSPFYMSPEQIASPRDVDARTDVWAIGVILYELLRGSVPFSGATLLEIATQIATAAPPSLRGGAQKVPIGLEQAIHRCLQKERSARFDNVAGLSAALQEFGPSGAHVYVERIAGTLEARPPSSALGRSPSNPPGRPPSNPSERPPTPRPPKWPPERQTIAPIGQTLSRGRHATKGVVAALVAVCAMVGTGLFLGLRHATIRPERESGAALATPPPGVVDALPAALAETRPSTIADATAPAVAASESAPRSRKHSAPNPLQRTVPPTIASAKNTNNCRLISSFDAEGNQHFKQECGGN